MGRFELFAAVLTLALAVAWFAGHEWDPDQQALRTTHARTTGGDEPHYLIAVHSLLFDGDFDVGNQYAHMRAGGVTGGVEKRGERLRHHTYVLDPETGRRVPWQYMYRHWRAPPCKPGDCPPFEPMPRHGFEDLGRLVEVPSHPAAFYVLVAGLLAPFQPARTDVERDFARLMLLFGMATLFVLAAAALRAGLEPAWALAPVALLTLASPWLVYSKSFFSEGALGLAMALALWAALAGRWAAAGLAAGAAMAVKPIFVLVGVGWLVERALARDRTGFVRLALAQGAVGVALLAFNRLALGHMVIDGGHPWVWANGLETLRLALIGPTQGLLVWVPWLLVALVPPRALWRTRPDASARQAAVALRRIAWPTGLFLVAISSYGYYSGASVGPRYWVPFLPGLALATVLVARHAGLPRRLAVAALALPAALAALPAALCYRHVFMAEPFQGLALLLQ